MTGAFLPRERKTVGWPTRRTAHPRRSRESAETELQSRRMAVRLRWLVAFAVVSGGFIAAIAQENGHIAVSVVEDWSSRHVIFAEEVPRELRGSILAEPRFWQQYYRRHASRPLPSVEETRVWDNGWDKDGRDDDQQDDDGRDHDRGQHHRKRKRALSHRDWSVSLGAGSGGRISGPAKYVFDVTAPPSCTTDFVVTGIAANGSSTQANIVGFNNLYSNTGGAGFCTGTGPNVIFAYNVGGGQVPSLVALSLNGQKVAFSENNTGNSNFHVLTFKTGTGNGTSATAPAVPGTGNTAVDTKIAFTGGATTGPYIDYTHDVAYLTTNGASSVVHKISGVFNGTPTEVTGGGWPATITGNPGVSTPVYDNVSRHVFVTDGAGHIDYIDDSVTPAVVHSGSFSFAATGITAAPVVVDSSRQKVYAFAGNPGGTNAVVAQADTSLTAASKVVVNIGTGSANAVLEGDFNNVYYSGGTGTPLLYAVGNDSSTTQRAALFAVGFNSSFVLNSTTANGPLALSIGITTGVIASPVTEFFNSKLAKDFLFVSVSNACAAFGSGLPTGGCIRSLDITGGFPASTAINNVVLAATGGTGTITVDNNSASAQASSVYYTTQTGNTIVKATQAGLQ
jgi:hypothetical protein